MGIVFDKQFWGRGYSGERTEVFIEIVFNVLDLETVAVGYIDGNEQSKQAVERYVEKFGGTDEGLLRNWLAVGSEVFDCHRYSIRREQYQ
ncbi:GNAT family N-acetyltransferase [Halocatena marina]|uniref:GNAT family N-acetyltransferase n=1 Tax=Halocatena marina TaxID=2934937 RepID=UPI0035A162D4